MKNITLVKLKRLLHWVKRIRLDRELQWLNFSEQSASIAFFLTLYPENSFCWLLTQFVKLRALKNKALDDY